MRLQVSNLKIKFIVIPNFLIHFNFFYKMSLVFILDEFHEPLRFCPNDFFLNLTTRNNKNIEKFQTYITFNKVMSELEKNGVFQQIWN